MTVTEPGPASLDSWNLMDPAVKQCPYGLHRRNTRAFSGESCANYGWVSLQPRQRAADPVSGKA